MALRSHMWALSDAVLTGAAVLKSAGGGLPQRVTRPATTSLLVNSGSQQSGRGCFDASERFYFPTGPTNGGYPAQVWYVADPSAPAAVMGSGSVHDIKCLIWEAATNELLGVEYSGNIITRYNTSGVRLGDYGVVLPDSPGYPTGLIFLSATKIAVGALYPTARVHVFDRTTKLLLSSYVLPIDPSSMSAAADDDHIYAVGNADGGLLKRWRLSTLTADQTFGSLAAGSTSESLIPGVYWSTGNAPWSSAHLGPDGHLYHAAGSYHCYYRNLYRWLAADPVTTPEILAPKGRLPGQLQYGYLPNHTASKSDVVLSPSGKWMAFSDDDLVSMQRWNFMRIDAGRARFSRTFTSAATVEQIIVPGNLGREDDGANVLRKSRCYYSTDGGANRTEFSPGTPLSLSVAANATLTVDVDTTGLGFADGITPWIAGDAGEGPTLIYDDGNSTDGVIVGTVSTPATIVGTVTQPATITGTVG